MVTKASDGCEFGHENRLKVARVKATLGTAMGFLSLLVAAAAVIFSIQTDHTKASLVEVRSALIKMDERFHVPESEHRALAEQVSRQQQVTSDIRATLAASNAKIDAVKAATDRIETSVEKLRQQK